MYSIDLPSQLSYRNMLPIKKMNITPSLRHNLSGFGGAEVACWPLIPKFAGSNPAEAVGFLKGDKKFLSTPSFGRESVC